MSRTRAPYESNRTVLDFPSPIEYVKNVLDSKSPEYKGGYETAGHVLLSSRYSNLKDEKQKKLIAKAIVELLDDPDYSCDAIPVASELGLQEAKEWFLKLSKKPLNEIRQINTSDYVNGFVCLINYASKHESFLPFLKNSVDNFELTKSEISVVLYNLSEVDSDFILKNFDKHLKELLPNKKTEQDKLTCIAFLTSGIFKKNGDGYCIDLAKRFKENLSKEYQILFYKALEQNSTPRFIPYLEDLKKILEISE